MLSFHQTYVQIAGVEILRDINCMVGNAETVALIGRNGAGKTTLLRSVMGFTSVAGRICFDEQDLSSVAACKRASLGIGYAPEDRRLFSAFSVEENITLPSEVAGLSAVEINVQLERVYEILPELHGMAHRPAGTVSGGQGKMIALGRALMVGTRLIMLDEPFQGLAPALANRYSEALRDLRDKDRSVTLIITESNPNLLRQFADRVLIVERGEISEGSGIAEHTKA